MLNIVSVFVYYWFLVATEPSMAEVDTAFLYFNSQIVFLQQPPPPSSTHTPTHTQKGREKGERTYICHVVCYAFGISLKVCI